MRRESLIVTKQDTRMGKAISNTFIKPSLVLERLNVSEKGFSVLHKLKRIMYLTFLSVCDLMTRAQIILTF